MKLKKLWLYILTPLLVLLGSVTLTNTVQAQELKNVITNVQVWDVDNGKLKEPDTNGVYDLSINKTYSNYKYMVNFDLSQYNGQLADGQDDQYTYSSSKEFDLNKNHKDQMVNGGWHKNLKKNYT